MYEVRVSARLLSWPQCCVCCGGLADTSYQAAFTRTTGKRVIKTDTRSWAVPYCSRCRGHVEKARQAKTLLATAIVLGTLGGLLAVWKIAGGDSHSPTVTDILVGVVVFVVGGGISTGLCMLRSRALAAARQLTRTTCPCLGEAVAYCGWYGSVHTFLFASQGYASAFMGMNRSKLVG
jgi:hypothetical protein